MSETVVNLVRRRGDTYPVVLYVVDTEGTPVNIFGCTFKMTADPSQNPTTDANNIFQLTGTIVSTIGGQVTFDPTASDTDHVGDFFYDIEMVDGDGIITTLVTGSLTLQQDITKPTP